MEMTLGLYKIVRIPNSFHTFDYIPVYFSDSTHMVHSRIHRRTSIDHRYNMIWPPRRTFDDNRTLACKHDRRNMAHHNIAGFPNSVYLSPMGWTVSENYHPNRGLYDLWITITQYYRNAERRNGAPTSQARFMHLPNSSRPYTVVQTKNNKLQ